MRYSSHVTGTRSVFITELIQNMILTTAEQISQPACSMLVAHISYDNIARIHACDRSLLFTEGMCVADVKYHVNI